MNNDNRRALTGSIHKVREFELEKVSYQEQVDIKVRMTVNIYE